MIQYVNALTVGKFTWPKPRHSLSDDCHFTKGTLYDWSLKFKEGGNSEGGGDIC